MEEEDCCLYDALLVDVVQQGKAARQRLRSVECNPEEAWTDGYVAGWFDGHFQRTRSSPLTEPIEVANRTEPLYRVNRTEQNG